MSETRDVEKVQDDGETRNSGKTRDGEEAQDGGKVQDSGKTQDGESSFSVNAPSDFGYVLATRMLVDGRRRVRYMYHEAPDDLQDSGWRFFCGDEDDDYVSNPDNIDVYDVRTILSVDPTVRPYLESAEGTAWEREDENAAFTRSTGFAPERSTGFTSEDV